jgi:hypothetical protein
VKQTSKDEKRWNADRPLLRAFEDAVNYVLIILGAYVLVAGTYVSLCLRCAEVSTDQCDRSRYNRL